MRNHLFFSFSLNRPETRNALSIELVNRMMNVLEQVVEEGRGIRCLVIRSMVTRVFSAGADLKVLIIFLDHIYVCDAVFCLTFLYTLL